MISMPRKAVPLMATSLQFFYGERSRANGNRLLGNIATELSTLNKMADCQPNATDKLRYYIQRLENTLEDVNDHLHVIPVGAVSTAVRNKKPSTDSVVTSVQPPNIDRDVLNYECDQAWKGNKRTSSILTHVCMDIYTTIHPLTGAGREAT